MSYLAPQILDTLYEEPRDKEKFDAAIAELEAQFGQMAEKITALQEAQHPDVALQSEVDRLTKQHKEGVLLLEQLVPVLKWAAIISAD